MNGLSAMKQGNSYALDAGERGLMQIRADLFHGCFLLYPRSSAFIRVRKRFFLTRAIAPVC